MFRIESYITPIILSYVDKYVKNIRPEDSQMSMWGGEVSFQNLDLRLDVLEEELNLPFSFLSGHINELTIRVPWTKIASEPICITINTIEFVLKLKDPENGSPTAGGDSSRSTAKRKKISRVEEPTSPTGYMASLVNRIANNISIQCHNIIFKYVEEDLVMSMNIQLLSINSADINWSPAFVEISPIKVILRKIIEINDLTICLDKRNETGKIEMCEEPILYRCSLKLHLLRRYNVSTLHKASLLRVDLKSESMHLNISSVQFPMAMRLFHLLQALKDGSLEKRLQQGGNAQTAESNENLNIDGEGFISWAWNLLPTIFPEDNSSESSDDISEHIIHFGYVVDDVQIVLKNQEPMTDSIANGSKKVKYRPLFRLQFSGCTGSSIGVGRRWSTFQGAVQRIQMLPLETCVCGKSQSVQYFIKSEDNMDLANPTPQDSTAGEKVDQLRLYNTNWEDYFLFRSDDELKGRSEAIVVDICYSLEVPDDNSTRLSEVGSDLELSGLKERHLMRVFCKNLKMNLGASATHVLETLRCYANQYNYPPYLELRPIPNANQLTPPSSDDYEALMAEVPLRRYELQMSTTTIDFDFTDHKPEADQKRTLSCELGLTRISYLTPFYPNRLVFTTCQLPQAPMKLFEACYQRLNVCLSSVAVTFGGIAVGEIPYLEGYSREIIHPHLWTDPNVLIKDVEVSIPNVEAMNIGSGIIAALNDLLHETKPINRYELENPLAEIRLKFLDLKCIKFETRQTMVQQLKLQQVSGRVITGGTSVVEFLQSKPYKESQNMLDLLLQTPLDEEEIDPAIILLTLGEVSLLCNNSLLELANLIERPRQKLLMRQASVEEEPKLTIIKPSQTIKDRPMSRRSGTVGLESVHSSSEKNATVVVPNVLKEDSVKGSTVRIRDLFERYKAKIISCDIKGMTIQLDFTGSKCVQRIRWPDILMTTSGGRVGELKRKVPISNEALDIVDKKRFFFPWSFQFVDFSCDVERKGQSIAVVENMKSNVTLLINEKEPTIEESTSTSLLNSLEIVLHVDTTPIVVNISDWAVNFMYLNVRTVQGLRFFKQPQMESSTKVLDSTRIEIAKRPISPDSSFDLNKLFDSSVTVDTTKDDSLTDTTEIQNPKETCEVALSVWMQLAFEKLHINLFCDDDATKLSLKAEDMIGSWDQKEAYSKIRTKVGSVSGKLLRKTAEEGKWQTDESLSCLGRNGEPTNAAFMDLTVTRAGTGIVHSKWGVKKKHRYMNHDLIEVMVKMQSLDCKLALDQLSDFICIFDGVRVNQSRPVKAPVNPETVTSVADVPLLFFESKGIQLYLPTTGGRNVIIMKINEISITPNVENPLTRNPVRADIYTKATQLGILNLPGSKIEDRQYEVQLKQMSLATADWNEMLSYMTSLGSGYENPAVSWNNPTKDQTLEICEIFKDFHFTVIVAPAIVLNNVLVCGPSIELSCVSDLNLKVRTDQCEELAKFKDTLTELCNREVKKNSLQQIAGLFKDKEFYKELKSAIKLEKAPKTVRVISTASSTELNDSVSRKSDSGISSMRVMKKLSKVAATKDYKMNIPYDVTFLGGNFYISLYEKKSSTSDENEDGNRIAETPMAKVLLYQPNLTLTQSIYDRTVNVGVFNVAVNLPDEDNTDEVFNSHQGKLNALGIPPSVVKLKFSESVTKERMLTINLFRPMKLTASERILKKLNRLSASLANLSGDKQQQPQEICNDPVPSEWIQRMRQSFFNSTKLSFSITQLECVYSHAAVHRFNLIISQLSANCLIQERPQRMTIGALIKGVSARTNQLTLIHPAALQGTVVISKEFWQKSPVITVSGGCSFLQIDVGPKNIICLQAILKSFEGGRKETEIHEKHLIETLQTIETKTSTDRIRLTTPKPVIEVAEEYYQDDLRAGAFQFVEISSDRNLPLPYQIHVINRRDNRIICWKYPQARALSNVEILPVPFNIVSSVKCCLEFYSESRGEFMSFTEFSLSESHIQTLKLPKQVTACVWRVVMRTPTVQVDGKLFEEESSSIEDDLATNYAERTPLVYNINDILQTAEDDGPDGPADNILTLHPKILIACMKVDSLFNPALIANCNLFLHVHQLEVNVMNQLVEDQFVLPSVLANYKGPCNLLPLSQHVCQIRLDNIKMASNIFDDLNVNVQLEFGFEINLVDYAYLRLIPFVEHLRFHGYYDCDVDGVHVVNLIIPDSLKIRPNPSNGHTLNTMIKMWSQSVGGETEKEKVKELVLMTRLIICNSTNAVIYYGQSNTADLYPILAKGFDFYAFRSVISPQSLNFSIDGEAGRVQAEECPIGEDGEQCLRLGNSFMVVTIKSIGSTQRLITVRGQMEIFNLSREKFVVEIGTEERKPLMLLDKSASVISQRNLEEWNVLRICFESIGHWSGDIPIRPSGKRLPWLVKVPVAKNKYLSYWIRVVKSQVAVGNEFARLVVIVLPLYLVRSYLPKDTIVEELKLQKTCQVFGRGALNELHLMGTHDDEHVLKFNENYKTAMGQDKSEILLSYKTMDVAKVFPILEDQAIDVPKLIQDFEGFSYEAKQWPIDSDCESKISRLVSEPEEHFVPHCDFGSLLSGQQMFNTLVLEVAPWCIFINSSGLNVFLKNNKRSMDIAANHLGTPFDFVDGKFTVRFEVGDGSHLESPEIHLSSQGASKKDLILVDDGEVLSLEMASENGKYLLKMLLSARKEKNRRIFLLTSQYVAVNYSSFDLSLFAITVPVSTDKNMFFSRGLFPNPEVGSYKLRGAEDKRGDSVKGLALPIINNEFISKKKPKKDPRVQYLIVQSEGQELFCPINISEAFNRKTLHVSSKTATPISLIVSMNKEKEQFFLSIIEDPCPDIVFHNRTDYNLCIAQSESLSKLVGPVKECEHFQWFPVLPGREKMTYSPSLMYKNYPQLTSTVCGITVAVTTLDGSQLRWSHPFSVAESGEFYLALPSKNDCKVTGCTDFKTHRVVIEPVNTSEEFTLRNVRSRLLHPIPEEDDQVVKDQVVQNGDDSELGDVCAVPVKWKLTVFIKEIGLFVATEDKERNWAKLDIVSVTMDDVLLQFDVHRRQFKLETGHIQIDNQLAHTGSYDFPVVFCADSEIAPRDIRSSSVFYLNEIVRSQVANPLFTLQIKLYAQEMDIEELQCTMRPIRLYLEDTYLSKLGDAVMEFLPQNAVYATDQEVTKETLTYPGEVIVPRELLALTRSLGRPLKIKLFKISSVDVLISLHMSTRLYIALDHSPLSFSDFERTNLRTTEMKLGSAMSMHYLSGAIFGAGWMVGSLEILGSPSGLARSVTTGLKDFVSMPVEGLFKGPWEFMLGVSSGSASLVRNITAGTVNSVTKLATSVARNLDRLTLDDEHVQRTDLVRRYKPLGVAEGFTQGLTEFGITLLGAVGGIARHTLAARTPGQVLSGVGKGLMGVILKPISGAAEFVAYTGNGVLHSVGYNTLPTCRSLTVAHGVLSPSQCQLSWKILQPILDTNQILFMNIVTLMKDSTLVPSLIGFSETVVISLDLLTDEVVIVPMSVVHPQIDANDSTVVHLRIVSKIPPTDDNEQFINFHHIASRVREYIQSSREHLPTATDACVSLDLSEEIPIEEGFVIDRIISFYVQSELAQHIVDYMQFLKYYNHEKYSV